MQVLMLKIIFYHSSYCFIIRIIWLLICIIIIIIIIIITYRDNDVVYVGKAGEMFFESKGNKQCNLHWHLEIAQKMAYFHMC